MWFSVVNKNLSQLIDVSCVHILTHTSFVTDVVFSPDGTQIATASHRSVQTFEVVTGRKIGSFFNESEEIPGTNLFGLCFSPDGLHLAAAGNGHTWDIKVWDIELIESTELKLGVGAFYDRFTFSPDGKRVVTVNSGDGILKLWDLNWGSNLLTLSFNELATMRLNGRLDSIMILPDGKSIVTNGHELGVAVWEAVESGSFMSRLTIKSRSYRRNSMACFPNGSELLLLGSPDTTLEIWEASVSQKSQELPVVESEKAPRAILKPKHNSVISVGWSPDGKSVFAADIGGYVHFWDAYGRPQFIVNGHTRYRRKDPL